MSDDEWLHGLCRPCDPTDSKPGPTDAKAEDEWLHELCRSRGPTDSKPGPTDAKADQEWIHELCRSLEPPASSALDAKWLQTLSVMSVAPAALSRVSGEPVEEAAASSCPTAAAAASSRSTSSVRSNAAAADVEPLATPFDGSIVWEHLFRFSFADELTIRQVLNHCSVHIHRRLNSMGLVIFKIGIAADPEHRFNNQSFGYMRDGYMFMDVLWRGSARDCCFVEDALILEFQTKRGCQNQNRGGGGVDPKNTSYRSHVYAVFAPCGDGIGIMAAARKRRRFAIAGDKRT